MKTNRLHGVNNIVTSFISKESYAEQECATISKRMPLHHLIS